MLIFLFKFVTLIIYSIATFIIYGFIVSFYSEWLSNIYKDVILYDISLKFA